MTPVGTACGHCGRQYRAEPIGGHRVQWGDATAAPDVDRLLDGQRVEMVWTDPPYGVEYRGGGKPRDAIENDDLGEREIDRFLRAAFTVAIRVCRAGAAWYVASPPGPLQTRWGIVMRDLGIHRQTLIWAKNNATFAPLGQDYHWMHEPILYGWVPGAAHRWRGDRRQETLIRMDRPSRSDDHPTMKPVALVEQGIHNSSDPDDIVLDLFLGSGTTIVAADAQGRCGYGLEIKPEFVDVSVRRWERVSGRRAVLIRDGAMVEDRPEVAP